MATTTTAAAMASATGNATATGNTTAPVQGGIIEGINPLIYSTSNPINLFIIQACIIIIFCRLLHYPFSLLGQPRVIAEVIGGIILGPSVMMRIPGFQDNVFPAASMPNLSVVANLGLILFLFLVGLEVDTRLFRSNWKVALNVGLAGMIIPFGLGYAIAWGIYNEFKDDTGVNPISFATFGLFVGTAMAITAFPVLCRILTELQLLTSPVGLTVLAAGIGNDVTGWILLALSVALVNNSNGLDALYVLLTAVAWILFLVFAVRPALIWTLRRNGSFQSGPSTGMIALTLVVTLISAWFTASIGVHPIFGAFLAGIICPHEGGFNIRLTRKIEDLVSVLLVPLYFAFSGLSTNLGLLDNGITWAYVVGIIACAFFGKVIGGTLAARASRLLWGESLTVGVLMSCKGLVELIVLNIGLQAKILSQRTFTMFVVMALVTTVATTPLVKWLYPMAYRKKVDQWKRGEIEWDGTPITTESQATQEKIRKVLDQGQASRLTVQLRLDTLPSLFSLVSILGDASSATEAPVVEPSQFVDKTGKSTVVPALESDTASPTPKPLSVHGVRLVALNERTSSVMQSAEMDEFADEDFVCSTFQTFSRLHGVAVTGSIAAVPSGQYANAMVDHSKESHSDLMLIPWSSHGNLSEETSLFIPAEAVSLSERFNNRQHIDYVQETLRTAACNVGVFIGRTPQTAGRNKRPMLAHVPTGLSVHSARDRFSSPTWTGSVMQHIFFAFIGGRDDRAALTLVLQLAKSTRVSVTVAHCVFPSSDTQSLAIGAKEAAYEPSATDLDLLATAKQSAQRTGIESRIQFTEITATSASSIPEKALAAAKETVKKGYGGVDDLVVVGRAHECLWGVASDDTISREFQRAVGVIGDYICRAGIDAGVLVIQAGPVDTES